ncbi:hypothetical protein SO802_007779 [Lithocarpus litseifolius]|uniref:RNase H type-1 domain-containing protein n=1 Tax=Lithocarpus litseifolius TaxID=425828 RepID=A0AAW2DQH8_9ROSI
MSEEVGRELCSRLGRYIESDKRSWLSEQAKFMRLRVDLPIDKPLQKGEMKISHAIFESNALSIVQASNQGDVGGEIGHILQDIRTISFSFSWCTYQHMKRDGNRVAYELAKAAKLSGMWGTRLFNHCLR